MTLTLPAGSRLAVTVPTRFPERVSWAINYRYHDTPGGHVRIYRQHELEGKLEQAGLWLRGSHHAHALHSPYWWLKCAYGVDRDVTPVRKYHEFLCWAIEHNPRWQPKRVFKTCLTTRRWFASPTCCCPCSRHPRRGGSRSAWRRR